MVEIKRSAAPTPVEALAFEVVATVDFVIIFAEGTASNTDAEISAGQDLAEPEFTVEIDRGHGHAERHVGAQERGIVVVIVSV
jgi:hypothetical protein